MHSARPVPLVQSSSHGTRRTQDSQWDALHWLVGAFVVAGALALVSLWGAVMLAAWAAIIARPLYLSLAKRIHRRKGAAAVLTVLLVVAFLAPLVVVTLSLSGAAIDLGHRLLDSKSGTEALKALAAGGGPTPTDLELGKLNFQQAFDLVRRHGASAMGAATTLVGAATVVVIGVVVFVASFYCFLSEGPSLHQWLLERSPLARGHFHRLGSAFAEVGRGLLVGVGLTALLQGIVATVGYVATGVPQPLVLGLVTVFAALIPSVGSGLVWLPVTAGLWVSGRTGAAIAMLVIGIIVSIVDNVMRPFLTRYGDLRMHSLVLFISMLGGIAVFGGGGLLLGPLFVRLAIEGLAMLREHREEEGLQS
jgi:predicted PurR-regulated permease PerM